ncbi:hypothetical protein [Sphingomonas sp.]|uniref:hypothetical protein n=1 Tax=Sphingomonas sp. TaxID=28214 RepID=UPI0035BC4902
MRTALALALAGVALSAFTQDGGQDRPESILPPGFGEPAPPAPRATRSAETPAPAAPVSPAAPAQPLPSATPTPPPTPSATLTPDAALLARYEMPPSARRSLALVGAADERESGVAADAFGAADGAYLEQLMRRLDAPLPSRWMSILLRRTLTARLDTPARVNGADFAAERAWLLLRMGEATAARAVVQGVDTGNYTPKLYQVAMNAMLAASDPAGLCPVADAGARFTGERGWTMAQAMCAALSGGTARANALLKAARRGRVATGVDLLLAQKVIGAAGGGGAVTIEWPGVDRLTVWRFGLASATGAAIPDDLYAGAGRQATYWRALSPAVPLAERVAPAEAAAGQGVLSNLALVDLYGAVDAADDAPAPANATAADLRTAYTAATSDARMAALRQLWGTNPDYGRLVLTARAAVRIRPAAGNPDEARIVASLLAGGLDRTAARWRGQVEEGGDAWAMLVLADPDLSERLSYSTLAGYAGTGDAALKQRLLFAGLAGLGRLAPDDIERAAQALDVRIGAENAWTRALDRAARANQPGTVALLAAIGMQTPRWRGVPPEMLYRIVGALRAVGLGGEARMIAAEAIARG